MHLLHLHLEMNFMACNSHFALVFGSINFSEPSAWSNFFQNQKFWLTTEEEFLYAWSIKSGFVE